MCTCAWTTSLNESTNLVPSFRIYYRSDLGEDEVAAKEATKHNEIREIKVDVDSCLFPSLQRAERRPRGDL